ncbi:hypothetical protein [uncultured Thalassospira sp.]|jgi:hypothetical protein|uniref:hypothetical protein n=1 Tax=uncultured Thalassospira sp. TaxID=404382 RepID=UPI0030DD5FFE|tara:strand:+ start:22408 stop:23157 length:750 start_codon:yes stop_codon:yes gene_type:complete
MGIFDWPAPAFSWLDAAMADPFGPLGRIIIWSIICAIVSMVLYALLSPQNRIKKVKSDVATSRQAMADDDGEDFASGMKLAKAQLGHSLKLVGVIVVPAIVASLPALALLVWLDGQYGYTCPAPGTPTTISASPENAHVEQIGTAPLSSNGGACPIVRVSTTTDTGTSDIVVPLQAAVPVIGHHQWWNTLIGNPAGYLPENTPIQQIRFDLPTQEIIPIGPDWARGWELTFFVMLILVSVAIKKGFRIE